MLPPLAILLLLGSVAAANNVQPCATSLIRGVDFNEISLFHNRSGGGSGQLTVKCAGKIANNSLLAMRLHTGPDTLHAHLYDSLTCDTVNGWTANMESRSQYDIVANATSTVGISCFEYNWRPCAIHLITEVTSKEVDIDHDHSGGGKLTVKCGNSSLKAIMLHSGPRSLHSNLYDSLTCDVDKGWTANMYNTGQHDNIEANGLFPVRISCFEYCAVEPLSRDLIIGTSLEAVSVECPEKRVLFYDWDRVGSSKLTCSQSDGWRHDDSTVMYRRSTTPMEFECRSPYLDEHFMEPRCDPSLIKGISRDQIALSTDDKGELLMTCVHGAAFLSEISIHHPPHQKVPTRYLACGQKGWKLGRKMRGDGYHGLPKNSSSLQMSCVEYCALEARPGLRSGVGVLVEHSDGVYSHVVTCAEAGEQLFHEGKHVPRNEAMCNKFGGWYYYDGKDYGYLLYTKYGDALFANTEKIFLECRKDSPQHDKRISGAVRTEKEEKEETRG